jgi:hypothetical protein
MVAPFSPATWFSLLTIWFVGVAVIVAIATQPVEEPALLRVRDTRGPQTRPALVTMPLEEVRWAAAR